MSEEEMDQIVIAHAREVVALKARIWQLEQTTHGQTMLAWEKRLVEFARLKADYKTLWDSRESLRKEIAQWRADRESANEKKAKMEAERPKKLSTEARILRQWYPESFQ